MESKLGVAELGRLRCVNRAWKHSVDSNLAAWAEAERAALGPLARLQQRRESAIDGGVLTRVPVSVAPSCGVCHPRSRTIYLHFRVHRDACPPDDERLAVWPRTLGHGWPSARDGRAARPRTAPGD